MGGSTAHATSSSSGSVVSVEREKGESARRVSMKVVLRWLLLIQS